MPSDTIINHLQELQSDREYLLFVDPTRTDLDEVKQVLSAADLLEQVFVIPTIEVRRAIVDQADVLAWLEKQVSAEGGITLEWASSGTLFEAVVRKRAGEKAAE
jgi:hypothetical protein